MAERLVISDKEMQAVLKLNGPQRYSYFVKRVAAWETAWGLWQDDGWALFADDDENICFPVWPAREYAEACAIGDWIDYVPEQVPLNDLLDELPSRTWQNGEMYMAVFATPTGKGIVVPSDQLRADLEVECERYE